MQAVEHYLVILTNVLLVSYTKAWELALLDVPYGVVRYIKICNRSPRGPQWILAPVEVDCLKCLLGNLRHSSTRTLLDIFYIVKLFLPSEDNTAGSRGQLCFEIRFSSYLLLWTSIQLTRLYTEHLGTVKAKISIIYFWRMIERCVCLCRKRANVNRLDKLIIYFTNLLHVNYLKS